MNFSWRLGADMGLRTSLAVPCCTLPYDLNIFNLLRKRTYEVVGWEVNNIILTAVPNDIESRQRVEIDFSITPSSLTFWVFKFDPLAMKKCTLTTARKGYSPASFC
jgi:hypothetical protein